MNITDDSNDRKNIPLARGVLDYFPAALAEVARLSAAGNAKHNPGEELHHARGKSTDHADCILRHLADRGTVDSDGFLHEAKVAWRALAMLQESMEAGGAPLARGARVDGYTGEDPLAHLDPETVRQIEDAERALRRPLEAIIREHGDDPALTLALDEADAYVRGWTFYDDDEDNTEGFFEYTEEEVEAFLDGFRDAEVEADLACNFISTTLDPALTLDEADAYVHPLTAHRPFTFSDEELYAMHAADDARDLFEPESVVDALYCANAVSNRIAGDSPEAKAIKNPYYKHDPHTIKGYCAACDKELLIDDECLVDSPGFDVSVLFCSFSCRSTLRAWQGR